MLCLLLSTAFAQDAFQFTVVGDTQTDGGEDSVNWDVLTQLIDDMNTHDPAFGLFVGDLVGGASSVSETVSQWGDFKSATAAFSGQIYAVPGNHDFYGGVGTQAAWAETFPWLPQDNSPPGEEGITYWFDYGNTRFISVLTDSIWGYVPVTQQAWLDGVLADSADKEHVFVYTHHPVSFSDESPTEGSGGDFWQSLVANGVAGLFTGHWHRYQPSQLGAGGDTWEQIIGTGGGYIGYDPIRPYQQVWGYGLVTVDGARVTLEFYGDADSDGSYDDLLDSYVMVWDTAEPHGLIAQYLFGDDGLRDTAPEPLGRGIDAVRIGDAALVDDPDRGQVAGFDGNGDGLEAGAIDDYVLSLNGDLTLSAWARFDALGSGTWANAIVCYGTGDYYTEDEETNFSYWLSVQSNGTLLAFWEHTSGSNVSVTSTVPASVGDGGWHHYSLVRSAEAMTATFYVDGTALGAPVSFDRLPTSGGRGMLYMGMDAVPFDDGWVDGAVDDLCIYDTVLGPVEVAALAAGGPCEVTDTGTVDTGDSGGPTDTGTSTVDTGDSATTSETDDSGTGTSPTDSTVPGDSNESDDTGCGCSPGAPLAAAWWLALVPLAWRRRR
jgi:hypothetical protein